jgi:predicted GIY-YIG superfamily endonuclease
LWKQRSGEAEGFAKRYHLNRLAWLEHFCNVRDAIACEKKLKVGAAAGKSHVLNKRIRDDSI